MMIFFVKVPCPPDDFRGLDFRYDISCIRYILYLLEEYLVFEAHNLTFIFNGTFI